MNRRQTNRHNSPHKYTDSVQTTTTTTTMTIIIHAQNNAKRSDRSTPKVECPAVCVCVCIHSSCNTKIHKYTEPSTIFTSHIRGPLTTDTDQPIRQIYTPAVRSTPFAMYSVEISQSKHLCSHDFCVFDFPIPVLMCVTE